MRQKQSPVKSVDEIISICLNNNLTFAAYRLPNQSGAKLIVQKNYEAQVVEDLSNVMKLRGFLVAPFLETTENKMFIIKPDFYFDGKATEEQFRKLSKIKHDEEKKPETPLPHEVTQEEYLEQIKKISANIRGNEVQKVVLSRVKIVSHDAENQINEIFSNLCERFPNAFVYLFQAGEKLWIGATPEPFAFLRDSIFQTSSVAGTKENTEVYQFFENWGSKEKKEQQYVSDYINRVLNENNWENIKHHGPYVKQAGNLLHLRTDFTSNTGTMNGNIGQLIYNLHPTPAVCGFPKTKALEIIQSVEKHDREYYSGFLGPVGMEDPITLFVNLRCMKITGSQMVLFSGGGLTKDSDPIDEWHETEIKAGTLLSVIHEK